jgi:RNA polymerase sigma-70 factor (ECF subfamily)
MQQGAALGLTQYMAKNQSMKSETDFNASSRGDDTKLLAAILERRDKAAFSELFERYETAAYNLAFNLTHNRAMAEDAVQDAMLALWQTPKRLDSNEEVRGWILGIVAHKSLSLLRTRARSHKREERKRATERYEMDNTDADNSGLIQALREHIEKLPALERQILTLRYTDGLPQDKIGSLLSIPQQTISRRIQGALERLRGDLKNAGLASVLPLLSTSGLSEAISSGHTVPQGLAEKVMSRIAEGNIASSEAVRSLSRRGSKVAKSGGLFWFGAAALATALGASAYVLSNWQTTPKTVNAPAIKARAKFERTWDFNTAEAGAELKVINGAWKYTPDGGPDGSGCMETTDGIDTDVELKLDGFAEGVPLRVTFDWEMVTRQRTFRADVRWQHRGAGCGIISIDANNSQNTLRWMQNTIYVTPEFTSTYLEKNHVAIIVGKKAEGSRLLLALHGGAAKFDNVKISEIDPSEIPPVAEYLAAAAKAESQRGKGTIVAHGLKPLQEGKQVGIFFFDAAE